MTMQAPYMYKESCCSSCKHFRFKPLEMATCAKFGHNVKPYTMCEYWDDSDEFHALKLSWAYDGLVSGT